LSLCFALLSGSVRRYDLLGWVCAVVVNVASPRLPCKGLHFQTLSLRLQRMNSARIKHFFGCGFCFFFLSLNFVCLRVARTGQHRQRLRNEGFEARK